MESFESQKILKFLEEKQIFSLWHFTEVNNLPSIFEHKGLRSKEYLEQKNILNKITTGGDKLSHQLDRDLNNWNKISLNFTPFTPMAYHKKQQHHLVFIEVDYKICAKRGVIFTDRNATRLRNGQRRVEGLYGLRNIKWECIFSDPEPWNEDWRKYVQAEALIPDVVPLNYFRNIHFVSEASLEYGKLLCYEYSNYFNLFKISPQVFQDYKKKGFKYIKAIIFPFIRKVSISLKEINKINFKFINENSNIIRYNESFWMKIELFASAGSHAYIKFYDIEKNLLYEENTVFEKEDEWVWFPKFDFHKNLNIKYNVIFVEVALNNIKWFESVLETQDRKKVLTANKEFAEFLAEVQEVLNVFE